MGQISEYTFVMCWDRIKELKLRKNKNGQHP